MDNLDPFLTIAEMSVAFAGFASIVTIVARQDKDAWNPGNVNRFQVMVSSSLASAFFAMLPFSLLYFGFNSNEIWRYLSGVFAIYFLVLSIGFPAIVRLVRAGELSPKVAYPLAIMILSVTILQILAVIGAIKSSIGTYYLGTLCLLFLSAVSFARLVALCIVPQSKSNQHEL
jgi:hypothetical protein